VYSLPSIIRKMKSRKMKCRACSMNGGEEECKNVTDGKARAKETIRKTRM
jgi:hypothetical protein